MWPVRRSIALNQLGGRLLSKELSILRSGFAFSRDNWNGISVIPPTQVMARIKKAEPWYFKYLRREIRKIWQWSPERKKARKRALLTSVPEDLFECEECGRYPFTRKEVEIDHIIPVESLDGWDGWDEFVKRAIGVPSEGLQVVCKDCHSRKSAAENRKRRTHGKGLPE